MDTPTYERIAAELRARIASGRYEPGGRLPSLADLRSEYGVSQETTRKVFETLVAEGLVVSRPGYGFKVAEQHPVTRIASKRLSRAEREAGRGAFMTDANGGAFDPATSVVITREIPPPDVAELLAVEGECVARRRTMRADARVVQLATSWVPLDVAEAAGLEQTNTGPGGMYARIEDAGHRLHHFIERVAARPATEEERKAFGLPSPGRPVLVVTRIAYTAQRAVEVNVIRMDPRGRELEYEIPAD